MPQISSFAVQYANVDYQAVLASSFDLFITEGAPLPKPGQVGALSDAQVTALIAQGRTVVGYVNVAVTDTNRSYWNTAWTNNGDDRGTPTGVAPSWLQGQPTNNFGTLVKFWDPAWQDIVIAQAVALVQRGYSGIFLDDIGAYYALGNDVEATIRLRAVEMAEFVAKIEAAVSAVNPDAFVVANSDPYLVTNVTGDARGTAAANAYRTAVDAHLLENLTATAINYSDTSLAGELRLILESDGTPAYSPASLAWQHGVHYVSPNESYNMLGTVQYPGTASGDTLTGGDGPNRIDGGGGNDVISGNGGNDMLQGGIGDDILHGGAGIDRLYGGTGNDGFTVDRVDDLVFENAGEGTDTVTSSAGYYLYANIENLVLAAGAGDIFGVGNDLANTLTGNSGANLLLGGGGNDAVRGGAGGDTLYGQDGVDTMFGDAGIDYLIGGAGNDVLDGGTESDGLYGEDGDDTLIGGSGFFSDILVGGAGNDILRGDSGLGEQDHLNGDSGDDSYYVDSYADLTYEVAGGGTDTVHATINGTGYYLYGHVENLVLGGETPFGVGNDLVNRLTGSAAANWLLGGGGNDVLNGKAGNDVLFGEGGADRFVFERGTGTDTIGDFQVGMDKIDLTAFGFTSFAQVQAAIGDGAGASFISLGGGDVIVLNGVTKAALGAGDFILSAAAAKMVAAEMGADTGIEDTAQWGYDRGRAPDWAKPWESEF